MAHVRKPKRKTKFDLPSVVSITDLRKSQRVLLKDYAYSAELRYRGGVAFGEAEDISSSFIAIRLSSVPKEITSGSQVHVLVRSQADLCDIFFAQCTYVAAISSGEEHRLVLKTTPSEEHASKARPKRYRITPRTLRFCSANLGITYVEGEIAVEEISLTGFSGTILRSTHSDGVLQGLVLKSDNPAIEFFPVRVNDAKAAFRIIRTNQNSRTNSWVQFLEKWASTEFRSAMTPAELADLFAESTFLKGDRRKLFGKKVQPHLIGAGTQHDPSLMRRYIEASGRNFAHHMSIYRFTDCSWYLQEVIGGIAKSSKTDALRDAVLRQLKEEADHLSTSPGYVLGMYDTRVEVNRQLWDRFALSPSHIGLTASHIHVVEDKVRDIPRSFVFRGASGLSIREKEKCSLNFDYAVLQILDFWAKGSSNRTLNDILSRIGAAHCSNLWLAQTNIKDSPIALVYRIRSYYSANATGVINSVFVFLPSNFNDRRLFTELLSSIVHDNEVSIGTSDVLVVAPPNCLSSDQAQTQFMWFAIDLQNLKDGGP